MIYEVKKAEGNTGAWAGSNSSRGLYGPQLSSTLRAEFKKNKIKNVFVSVLTYTGEQHIYVKFLMTETDYVPYDEYLTKKMKAVDFFQFNCSVFSHKGKHYNMDDCQSLPEEERMALYKKYLKEHYGYLSNLDKHGTTINQYHVKKYADVFSEGFLNKLAFVKKIVDSFNIPCKNSPASKRSVGG